MSLRSRGSAALTRRMLQTDSIDVTYTRGVQSATVTLWVPTAKAQRSVDEPGASVVVGERDYLIPVANLVLGGAETTPQKGDRITEIINGAAVVFEIQTPGGEPAWRYSDNDRTRYRIHTKKVG